MSSILLQARKKAGKVTISLTGSLPHQTTTSNSNNNNARNSKVTTTLDGGVMELAQRHFENIEARLGDWKGLFELATELISCINNGTDDEDAKQAAQVALQSEAIQTFFLKFSSTLHARYYPHTSSPFSIATSSVLDLIAIPFDERRDSFPVKEEESKMLPRWVYDNRQKLRDAFVSLLQEYLPGSTNGNGTFKWTERHLAGKAKELLFSKALHFNAPWLAELFLGQFLKWYNVPRQPTSPSRMEMLEQRLKPKLTPPTSEECYEFFAILLRTSDSLGMVLALTRLVPEKINELEEQCCSGALRRNEMFRNAFGLLPGLVRMYSLLWELLQQPTKANIYFDDLLRSSKRKRSLFLHLKWALPQYTDLYEQSAFGQSQHSLLRIVGVECSEAKGEQSSFLCIDTDPNLDLSFVLEEAFPHLHSKLSLPTTSALLPSLPAPRKVQPVLSSNNSTSSNSSPSKTEPTVSQVQKDLRKWFWWQHPQEYELVKSLTAYSKSTNGEHAGIEQGLKALLASTLPPEVSQTIIKLALEMITLQTT